LDLYIIEEPSQSIPLGKKLCFQAISDFRILDKGYQIALEKWQLRVAYGGKENS
jgi:hypothetical protein